MNWKELTSQEHLEHLKIQSEHTPQVIFKHSTRCSISSMAKSRLERSAAPQGVEFNFLDLIRYRDLSNHIEKEFGVVHESPQVLLIWNGECIYEESHSGIVMDEIHDQVRK